MSYTNFYKNSSIFHASKLGVMGTQLDLLLVGEDETSLSHIWSIIEQKITSLHLLMSKFEHDGELYKVNSVAKQKECKVSDELWRIINDCVKFNKITDHYFDISLGYYKDLILNEVEKSISFKNSEIELDLGGYGKGYALQEIKKICDRYKINDFLVNFGNSSILAKGSQPFGECWRVDVNNPYTGEILHTYDLHDAALTTSGNMPSHTKHIINPKSRSYDTRKRVTSVCCKDPVLGEVLTTVAMLIDEREVGLLDMMGSVEKIYFFDL